MNFPRRAPGERHARSMFVVPVELKGEFVTHGVETQRDDYPAGALVLDRSDQPLDHSEAAVLAHRAEAWADTPPSAPLLERVTPKLPSLVADDVPRWVTSLADGAIQKSLDLHRCWTAKKDGEADHGSREVIDGDGDPPAEGPGLRQSERCPRDPEAGPGWDGREVDVPRVPWILGGHRAGCHDIDLGHSGNSIFRERLGLPGDSPNRRRSEMKSDPGQDLREAHLYSRKPRWCQGTTVSGWTMTRAERQPQSVMARLP